MSMNQLYAFIVLFLSAFILFLPLTHGFNADYSINTSCGSSCIAGQEIPIPLSLTFFYDVPHINDNKEKQRNDSHALQKSDIAAITITRVRFFVPLTNVTFFTQPMNVTFIDPRFSPEEDGFQGKQTTLLHVTIPFSTKRDMLYFVPCFTLTYKQVLHQYDFFNGGYESIYLFDTIEECDDALTNIPITMEPSHDCATASCSWYESCTSTGCSFSGGRFLLTVFIGLVVMVSGIVIMLSKPKRKKRDIWD